jgi:uncharacterized protein YndB with AHSA1/START domain
MSTSSSTADREICITRDLAFPRELVFKAWTEQKHIDAWWGPTGFRNATHEMSVKPGGVWRFMMHGPDGKDWPNKIVYIEVIKPERLVYTHSGDDSVAGGADDVSFHVTVDFEDINGHTRLKMKMLFASVEACEQVKTYGAVEGNKQTMDRLEQYLASNLAGAA